MKLTLATRRWWLLGGLTALLLAGYLALSWYFSPPASAINRTNAERIKPGMTLAEVEAILGGPERNESRRPRLDATRPVVLQPGESVPATAKGHNWQSSRYWILIWLDAHGRVESVRCQPLKGYWVPESWFDRVEQWFESWAEE